MELFDCDQRGASGPRDFRTTHWTVVVSACDRGLAESKESLERLCKTYWYPLYAYARRQGCSPEDAEDLTQGFFAALLERNFLDSVDRSKGLFRSFLLAAFKHYCANEWRRAKAGKRGGGAKPIYLDGLNAEDRYQLEPASDTTPEEIYDAHWALKLLQTAMETLAEEYRSAGQLELFEAIRSELTGAVERPSYAEIGDRLHKSANAVAADVCRLRKRFGQILRLSVAETVASQQEVVDQELRYLLQVLSRSYGANSQKA